MNPISFSRPAGVSIAVFAMALAGIVVAPVPAAHAAPTAWTCTVDTFVWRTASLNEAVTTSGVPVPTAGPALAASPPSVAMDDLNAIALHPTTGVVYAYNAGTAAVSGARVINPDGTVEDVSADVPFTNVPTATATSTRYAGGTFTPDGYWLLADAAGNFATVDLTSPASPTYGYVVHNGVIRNSAGGVVTRFLSGDMAYQNLGGLVYFTTWNADGFNTQVGSIPVSDFFSNADIVPTFGPTIAVPGGSNTSGAASGFDSAGNLWMSTNLVPANPRQQAIWRLDAADLTGNATITPANPVYLPSGSGTDGFMCPAAPTRAPASAPSPSPSPSPSGVAAGAGTSGTPGLAGTVLAETGHASEVMPIVGGGVVALLLGVAFMILARLRRSQARSFR